MTESEFIALQDAIRKDRKTFSLIFRKDFSAFVSFFHRYMWRSDFCFKPFHHELIKRLKRRIFDPESIRGQENLYIGMPPRFGKSQLCKYFAAWSIAVNPAGNHIYTSYSADLAVGASKEIRAIVSTPMFQHLFGVTIDPGSSAGNEWKTSAGGIFRASGLEGTITGYGAGIFGDGWGGCIFIDDFIKAGDYKSEATKAGVIDFYNQTLRSRLNKPGTPIITIAQRISKDDLIGYISETERPLWDFYLVKAMDEGNGESIWPEKISTEALQRMKETTPFTFYSQYQQEPRVIGGGVFKTEWWQFYQSSAENIYTRIYLCADTAMKTGEANDYTVIGVFGTTKITNEIHLLDMVRGKFEAPELEKVFVSMWEKWREKTNSRPMASACYIEDKASGVGLIQSIRRRGIPIIPMTPTKDKLTRAYEALPTISTGIFKLPESENNQISRQIITEAEEFRADMTHAHDDQIDVICYGIEKATSHKGLF